jgi:hypothetical protein
VIVAEGKHFDDMRVVDRSGDTSFFLEFGTLLLICAAFLLENLERDLTVEIQIEGSEHRAHAPFSEERDKPVVVELPVRLQKLSAFRAANMLQGRLIADIHNRVADRAGLEQPAARFPLRSGNCFHWLRMALLA